MIIAGSPLLATLFPMTSPTRFYREPCLTSSPTVSPLVNSCCPFTAASICIGSMFRAQISTSRSSAMTTISASARFVSSARPSCSRTS